MVMVKHYHYIRVGAPLPSVSVLGVLRLRCATSTRIMTLVPWWEHLFVCIKKFGLTAEAPLNEMTDNGAHTAK